MSPFWYLWVVYCNYEPLWAFSYRDIGSNLYHCLYFIELGVFVQSFVICPYCDPNHMAYPNMEEAVRGYDVPMGNPNPGRGESDPGIRNQIFNPMVRNSDGYYKLDGSWISANTQIKVL